MFNRILHELKEHSPFTMFGAMTGILLMMMLRGMPHESAHGLFYVLHPAHVILSAFVTTAMYTRYCRASGKTVMFWKVLIVGYLGAIGVGTLSDSLIPFWGEVLLDMPHREVHVGFIEKWWLINPLAVTAVVIAYFKPSTKFSHAGHVLISTWASLFHMLMAAEGAAPLPYFGIFIFLFLAVWVPCCMSDIVFPLLFVSKGEKTCGCCAH